jgi:hypothetical protein
MVNFRFARQPPRIQHYRNRSRVAALAIRKAAQSTLTRNLTNTPIDAGCASTPKDLSMEGHYNKLQ